MDPVADVLDHAHLRGRIDLPIAAQTTHLPYRLGDLRAGDADQA